MKCNCNYKSNYLAPNIEYLPLVHQLRFCHIKLYENLSCNILSVPISITNIYIENTTYFYINGFLNNDCKLPNCQNLTKICTNNTVISFCTSYFDIQIVFYMAPEILTKMSVLKYVGFFTFALCPIFPASHPKPPLLRQGTAPESSRFSSCLKWASLLV